MIRRYRRQQKISSILLLSAAVVGLGLITITNTNIKGATPPTGTQSEDPDDQSPIGNFILCAGNFVAPTPNICLGTNEADQIQGTLGADFIYAKNGKDQVMGQMGDDILYGQNGDDVLQGGSGADRLYGMDGDDFIYGDTGGNAVFGGGGNYLDGGKGDDVLVSGSENDVLRGGPGKNYFDCQEGTDLILDFDPDKDTKTQACEFF